MVFRSILGGELNDEIILSPQTLSFKSKNQAVRCVTLDKQLFQSSTSTAINVVLLYRDCMCLVSPVHCPR